MILLINLVDQKNSLNMCFNNISDLGYLSVSILQIVVGVNLFKINNTVLDFEKEFGNTFLENMIEENYSDNYNLEFINLNIKLLKEYRIEKLENINKNINSLIIGFITALGVNRLLYLYLNTLNYKVLIWISIILLGFFSFVYSIYVSFIFDDRPIIILYKLLNQKKFDYELLLLNKRENILENFNVPKDCLTRALDIELVNNSEYGIIKELEVNLDEKTKKELPLEQLVEVENISKESLIQKIYNKIDRFLKNIFS